MKVIWGKYMVWYDVVYEMIWYDRDRHTYLVEKTSFVKVHTDVAYEETYIMAYDVSPPRWN